jgi:hypothetical protein
MASIHKQAGRPHWFASMRANGKQSFRSTGILHTPLDPSQVPVNEIRARAKAQQMENIERAQREVSIPSVEGHLTFIALSRTTDPETRRRNQNIVQRFLTQLPGQEKEPLTIVLPSHVLAHRDMRALEIEASTVNMELSFLNVAFQEALEQGLIPTNPVDLEHSKLPETSSVRPLDIWQMQALLLATSILDWRTSIYIGFYTALHFVEAGYRLWTDIVKDPSGRPCLASPGSERKSAKSILIHPVLQAHFDSLPRVNEFICPNVAKLERATADGHFAAIAAKAGLERGTTFRCLRHTHAQFLGLPMKRIDTAGPDDLLKLPDIRVPVLPCQLQPLPK